MATHLICEACMSLILINKNFRAHHGFVFWSNLYNFCFLHWKWTNYIGIIFPSGISLTEEQWSVFKKNVPDIEKAIKNMQSRIMWSYHMVDGGRWFEAMMLCVYWSHIYHHEKGKGFSFWELLQFLDCRIFWYFGTSVSSLYCWHA